jgi:hypothetical protein
VTSDLEIFDVYSNWAALTDGLYEAKLGVLLDPGHSTCTKEVPIGETAYL